MTLEEKQELRAKIDEMSMEELKEARKQLEEAEEVEAVEEEKEEIKEEEKAEETEEAEKVEEPAEITAEEERKLIRNDLVEVGGLEKMETRNSKEYIEAYANYIKTNDDTEVRKLLTENVSGTIAVPDFVYDLVKTNWERNEIMSLVRRTSIAGNLKINFEISGSDAVVHTEGSEAVTEETLTLGIVELKPVSIKKWISISDEVYDMRGEEFLRYIYDELTYKIVKKTADELIAKIAALPTSATSSSPSANKVASAPAMDTIFKAIANLSDEAADYTIVMNKLTYANFKAVQLANNYAADIFDNVRVRFNNTLPAYDAANANAVYMIVGDFDHGTLANYPNGDGVDIKFDDTTLMTEDLIRILGRQYVGLGVVADKAFTLVTKPSQASI